MPETLTETFARYAEGAAFRQWTEERTPKVRFVYACQDDVIWKFTTEEWWRFVTRTIRNNGVYTLPLANQLHGRPKNISSDDNTIRWVNILRWTADNWKDELDSI
jgi:hypothetical protein